MTEQAGVICRRCGYANLPGDQFCGSCGAFLEWEGEATGAPAAPPPPDEGLAGLVAPAGGVLPPPAPAQGWVTAPGVQAPPPQVPPPVAPPPVRVPPPAPAEAGLLRCPACGIANGAARTFCQSCGARLAEAPRVGTMTREQITAAVSAKPGTPPATPGAAPRPDPAAGSGSRNILGWVVGMAVLGLLVGGGVMVGATLLKGQGPATEASTDPSAAVATIAPTSVPASTAPASDAPVVTPEPTPRVEGAKLEITGIAASSTVGDLAKFAPAMAIDGNVKTSWQEGAAVEKGQWIEVAFAAARVDWLQLNNGYGASTALYKGNLRLKAIEISINGRAPIKVTLKDTAKVQKIDLGEFSGATHIRITIVSTYPSVKTSIKGTPFDDAALGEIGVIGVAGG